MREHKAENALPFLVNFATSRTAHPDIGGRYCHDRHVWVDDGADGAVPIIHLDGSLLAAVTKTMTQQEADDEIPPTRGSLPELATKTEVQQESDDQISSRRFLLELETKTSFEVESDDRPIRN